MQKVVSREWEEKPDWEKIYIKDMSDKRQLLKIYKGLLKFNSKIVGWFDQLNNEPETIINLLPMKVYEGGK